MSSELRDLVLPELQPLVDDMQREIDRLDALAQGKAQQLSETVNELNEARSMALQEGIARFEREERIRQLEAIVADRAENLELLRRQTDRLDESISLQRQATESQVRTNKLFDQKLELQVGLQARVAMALEKIAAAVSEKGPQDV